jgi:phage terminase large subunit
METNLRNLEEFITDPNLLNETLWAKQLEVVRSVWTNTRTAVKSCHSSGKTRIAAGILLGFMYGNEGAKGFTTAPTWRQVQEQIWGEIRTLYKGSKAPLPGKVMNGRPILRIQGPWYAEGISTREPEKVQGIHAPYIIAIVDEASGISERIFDGIKGNLASGTARMLLLGNPTIPSGEFYDAFHKKSHMYNCISISAWDTPNLKHLKKEFDSIILPKDKIAFLKAQPAPVPYLITPLFVAEIIEEFGEDSPYYHVRVLGEFPSAAPDQLIALAWIEQSNRKWVDLKPEEKWWEDVPKYKTGPITIGADIARYGDCETVFYARMGNVFAPPVVMTKFDTVEVAARLKLYMQTIYADYVNIDEVGLGAGVVDMMKPMSGTCGINVGLPPKDKEKFNNLRSESFWHLREKFEKGELIVPDDDRTKGQLSTMKYSLRQKLVVEGKDDMRMRGVKSPDRADAMCLSLIRSRLETPVIRFTTATPQYKNLKSMYPGAK